MARIRDMLWRADRPEGERPAAPPAARSELAREEVCEEITEIPFIEVGGPHKQIEASPSVLAAAPAALAQRPVPKPKAEAAVTLPPAVTPAPVTLPSAAAPASSKGLTTAGVVFRPLSREAVPLPPANERFAPELVAFHSAREPVSEQYRVLLKDLQAQTRTDASPVLLFSAACRQTPISTLVLNLAITGARDANASTAVVDADLYEPTVAKALGLPQAPGLSDVLNGDISLQRALQDSGLEKMQILTAGKRTEAAGGLVAGQAMMAVLRHLRTRFDLSLVAAPPWDGRPELVALGSACDAVYLVVSPSQVDTPQVRELLQLLPRQGVCLRGCILAG
jgi:Mrp family chromosome partitioning ATPase